MVRTGPATRRFTGYAGLAAMLMLAFWLGGAANAWMAMGAAQRAAVSVRGWRRSQQRRGAPLHARGRHRRLGGAGVGAGPARVEPPESLAVAPAPWPSPGRPLIDTRQTCLLASPHPAR